MILSLLSLFASALLSATLFPAASEGVLVANIVHSPNMVVIFVIVASAGNILGSLFNWWIGFKIDQFKKKSWFPVSPKKLARAKRHFQRYGEWTLLLSWVPIIGDPLTLAAGVLNTPLRRFLVWVTLAKTGRYIMVAWLVIR